MNQGDQVSLTLEQQFNLQSFKRQVSQMSPEQAQYFLVELYQQMLLRETMYKSLLKQQWSIE
jgi:Phycobilisome degradation protein nblA